MKKLSKILEEQFNNYADIQVQDIYKLLYQANFGCEHAVDQNSRHWLHQEYDNTVPTNGREIIEMISPKDSIYRLNMAPYKYKGGDKDKLFDWFYRSSKIKTGTQYEFRLLWDEFKMINQKEKYFEDKKVLSFERIIRYNLPIMHHSYDYRQANEPSYRVVNRSTIDTYMQNMCF